MTIHFETLGCRLNHDETEGAAQCFLRSGFNIDMEGLTAASSEQPETVLGVINTCTVTGKAEQKARRLIRLMLQKLPSAIVLVTGCYAELDAEQIEQLCPDRIVVLPGRIKYTLAAVAQAMKKEGRLSVSQGFFSRNALDAFLKAPASSSKAIYSPIKKLDAFSLYTPVFEQHSRASIKIEDGCNNACTYCRIRLARGKAVSLPVEEIVNRISELEHKGMNEVVFTGVNLSQYAGTGNDGRRHSFTELLEILLERTEQIKFRVSSFYPQHVTDELAKVLASPRVQPSFHLSVQSGSDRILSLMARPYKANTVLQAAELLRNAKGNPFLSCDIIAGFPDEQDDDFTQTLELCNAIGFSWIHAFPFSPRPGTLAQKMHPQIPERIKGERVKQLTDLAVNGKTAYCTSFIGRPLSAIVENSRTLRRSEDGKAPTVLHCVSENFLHIECPLNEPTTPGSLIEVKIESVLEKNIKTGKEIDCRGTVL